MVAAYLPARRAGGMPPVAAMRDDVSMPEGTMRWRVAVGGVLGVAGLVGVVIGGFTDVERAEWFVGAGIFALVLGVALTGPLVGRPVIALTGLVYRRLFGAVGLMAEQNAIRNPRRTAATASALMIGLTLVSMMSVFGASAKASVDKAIEANFAADFVVSNAIGQPFSATVTHEVSQLPGVEAVSPLRILSVQLGDARTGGAAIDPESFQRVVPIDLVGGSLAGLEGRAVAVDQKLAAEHDLSVGAKVELTVAGEEGTYTVAAVYHDLKAIGLPLLIGIDTATAAGLPEQDSLAFVLTAPGADRAAVEAGLDKVVADLPTVTVKDQAAFAEEQRGPIDQMLALIYALLGLAVVIAVLGIVNTLALSVIERTREIGLLRAVGLSRRQLRTMLRLESVAIALLGAVLGVGLGLAGGWALQRALASDGIDVLAIPAGQLAVFVALAGIVGVLAALWPGRRAARLDVLRAITTE
jgi:putative ABC transport system permease protein